MVRASVTGAINFAAADLNDRYWWRKLRWTLDSLQKEEDFELDACQHRHWVTIFANSSLDDESFATAKANAQHYLTKLLSARYPEYAERLRQAAHESTRDGALEAYRARFGYPGDPRYEKMLQDTLEAFRELAEACPIDGAPTEMDS